MENLLTHEETALFCGDYNVAPTDHDVYDPKAWQEQILCSTQEREAFHALTHLGYTDILGFESPPPFTWWDYRGGAFAKNKGLRIDHILASPKAADRISGCYVDTNVRSLEKTSDHAPVIAKIKL